MGTGLAWSVALSGVDASPVMVTASAGVSEPLTGPPVPTGMQEVLERVRAAVRNSDLPWPDDQVTISTSSQGLLVMPAWDLAVACAVLAADGQVPVEDLAGLVLLGELALDGRIRPVRGVLPALLAARDAGHDTAIVPAIMLPEAELVTGMRVFGADRLSDVVAWLRGSRSYLATTSSPHHASAQTSDDVGPPVTEPDLAEIVGQPEATRALEVAAAGGHDLLLVGPVGAGMTRCAQCLPGLLPPLTDEQALEVTAIHSLAGVLASEFPLLRRPPFVAPHHTCSMPALLGGGVGVAKPGAISLAHHGVLLLDEAAEFGPDRLDAVRTAMEEREVRLAHRDAVLRYPARCQLIVATTPCACGQPERNCGCSPAARHRYLARLSGPLLDRIDLRERLRPPGNGTADTPAPDRSAVVRARAQQARQRAAQRWAPHQAQTNAEVPEPVLTRGGFRLPRTVTAPLDQQLDKGAVTGRGAVRTLRVAWTLADLAGLDRPGRDQITEALEFRDRRAI